MECNKCYRNQRTNMMINPMINFTENGMYGYAYVRNQNLGRVLSNEEGLRVGSIFPELIIPYSPGDSLEEINFLAGGCK